MTRVRNKQRPAARVLCLLLAALLIAACLPLGSLAAGEERTVIDPTKQGKGFSAVLYDNTNGLPTSEANAIAATPDGFLWIGSYAGLIRYDGNTFERLDSTTGLASVVSLFVDSRERLWVGTNESGMGLVEKGGFRMYRKADGLPSLSVRSILEDEDGKIYIGTTLGLAVAEETRTDGTIAIRRLDEPRINQEFIRTLKLGPDGVIYGITKDGDVFTLRDGALTGYYSSQELQMDTVRAILPDPQNPGYVYLAGNGPDLCYGRLETDFRGAEPLAVMSMSFVNSMELLDDTIWVCADDGIGLIRDGEYETFSGVPIATSVEQVLADYQGNLWFVSSQQGVMKVVPNQFEDIYKEYYLEDEVVCSTCLYDGMLFIGTKNQGLTVLRDGYTMGELPLESASTASGEPTMDFDLFNTLNGVKIRSLIRDSQNRLWISTFGETALMRYDGHTLVRFRPEDGLPSNRVRTVYERRDGTFLAACTGGLAVIEGDRITRVYGGADGITNTEVLTVCEGDDGTVFLGTDGGGIYAIRGDKVERYDTDSGLLSDVVMRIKRDRTRNLYWIVTSNSLAYMTGDGQITNLQKFPYSNNFDLYENSRDEMWVLASNGIYVLPVEELLGGGELNPAYYSRANGVPCIATANSYSELTENGDLYIAGTTGVARVNIDEPLDKASNIKLTVPYLEVDGERVYPSSPGVFTIPSWAKRVTVDGYVFTYSLSNPQVTYRLEGFEQNETTVPRSEFAPVNYTNLPGGEYRFVMQIQDSTGQIGSELSIGIIKEKSIREMLWYQILRFALALLIVVALIQFRFHRKHQALLKKQEENRTLIREMTEAFARTIDMKDRYTNGHSKRVAEYTSMLARELGYDDETVEKYYNIALLHDIGKIGIPSSVLNKPGKLTDEEYKIIQSHSSKGYEVLKDISIMPELATGAGAHHERPDGRGYPNGLKGEEIPRVAQIIAVADTFDAMYSTRPYRRRMNFDKVLSIIKEASGTQLTPDVVDAFLRLAQRGELRAPDDQGGGSTEDINNIHQGYDEMPKEERAGAQKI